MIDPRHRLIITVICVIGALVGRDRYLLIAFAVVILLVHVI